MFKESGGKVVGGELVGGWRTRLYTADRGGFDTILPQIELGLIECIDLRGTKKPWVWMSKAVQGRVPTEPGNLKWTREFTPKTYAGDTVGCWAYEGLTEWGDALMQDMREQAGRGVNIGGQALAVVEQEDSDDTGDTITFGGNNKAHYLMGQNRMNDMISQSMRLPGFLIWTAIDLRSADSDTARQVFGPDVGVGKAMTPKIPQKFTYTWRTVQVTKKGSSDPPKFQLMLTTHQDPLIPAVTCVCNARYPKDAPEELKVQVVDPSNMAEAYLIVKAARVGAKQTILERLAS